MFHILRFTERGKINCTDLNLFFKLAKSLDHDRTNIKLLIECHKLLQNMMSVQNVWQIIDSIGNYNCYIKYGPVSEVCPFNTLD